LGPAGACVRCWFGSARRLWHLPARQPARKTQTTVRIVVGLSVAVPLPCGVEFRVLAVPLYPTAACCLSPRRRHWQRILGGEREALRGELHESLFGRYTVFGLQGWRGVAANVQLLRQFISAARQLHHRRGEIDVPTPGETDDLEAEKAIT